MKTLLTTLSLFLCSLTLAAQTESILHSFAPGTSDGQNPQGGLIFDSSGNLYGTASVGGTNNTGVIFELSPSQVETILYNFGTGSVSPDTPNSSLLFDSAGNLYGTSAGGGYPATADDGTVFELTHAPKGTLVVKLLHGFYADYFPEPGTPAGILFDSLGNLWGTSFRSGDRGQGTLYEMQSCVGCGYEWSAVEKVSFGGTLRAGSYPVPGLTMDSLGNFYGATLSGGGPTNDGTVFEYQPSIPQITTLVSFNGINGKSPSPSGVIFDSQGNLYGATMLGGAAGKGNVYELSPNGSGGWTQKVLFAFNGNNGQSPEALTFDSSGNLYGTTTLGGQYGAGTLFKLSPPAENATNGGWSLTVIHNFGGSGDGATPVGNLIFDSLGNVYGVTSAGGANGVGTVWEVTP